VKKLLLLALFLPFFVHANGVKSCQYGVACTVTFNLFNTDGTLDIDEVDGGTEVTVHKNEDVGTTATNDFADEGGFYSILLTATETQAARVVLDIAATDREVVHIETYGHPLAQHINGFQPFVAAGNAQAGGTTTTTLAAGESFTDDAIVGSRLKIVEGAGVGQTAIISAWNNTTKVATHTTLITATDTTSDYIAEFTRDSIITVNGGVVDANVASMDADTLTGSAIATTAVDKIVDATLNEDMTAHQTAGTLGGAIGDPVASTESIYDAVVTDAAGTNVAADIIAVKAETALIVSDTNELQTDDIPGSLAALNDISTAEVNTQVDLALTDINLDHFVGTATGIPALPAGTYLDLVQDDGTAVYDRTTDSLQVISDSGGGGPTAAQIADAVLDEDMTAHQTLGSFGQLHGDPVANTETLYEAVITDAAGTNVAADLIAVKAETALIVADTNELQTDDTPAAIAALNDIAAGDVWAVDATSQQTQGTFGQLHGDSVLSTETIFKAVVTDASSANVSADVVAVKAETALIVADTNELQTDDIPGLITALNDVSTGEVNTQVDLALADINLDHFVGTATGIPALPAGTYLDLIQDDGTAVFDRTTDSLQAIADSGGGGPTAAQIADAVLDEEMTAHQTLGSFGQLHGDPVANTKTLYGAVVSDAAGASVTADVAAVKAETALIVADTGADGVALSAAAIDLIWNEILETAGATYTARCLMAAVLSYSAGEWGQSGAVVTYKDPAGVSNRIVGTIASPGFNTITITCP